MNGKQHLKYMLLGGAGIFGLLLLVGMPLTGALLVAVLLACPLMMVFMMGGHGGHGASNDQATTRRDEQTSTSDRPRGHQH